MDLDKAIAEEKKRITTELKELEKRTLVLHQELNAVAAYENAKKGTATRSTRGVSIKAQVLEQIKKGSSTRAEIITALGFSDNKSKQQTVSNTLSQLKKKKEITLKDGVYSCM